MKAILIAMAVVILGLLLGVAAFGQDIASVESWTVDPAAYAAHNSTVRRGETRLFEPQFVGSDLTAATNVIYRYRAIGMTNYWWITGTVYSATAGVVRIRWTPERASTQSVYSYEVEVTSSNAALIRAFGRLTLEAGIGASGSPLSVPDPETVDWAGITNPAPISAGDISSVESWPVERTARTLVVRRGETRILQPEYSRDLSEVMAVAFRYRPVSMTNYYEAAGEVATITSGVVRIKVHPALWTAASEYVYEITLISSNSVNLNAYGRLSVFDGLGPIPAPAPTVGNPFDWAGITEHLNLGTAPFPIYAWITNYVAAHSGVATGVAWGAISGNISNQTDLLSLIASNAGTGPAGPMGPTGTAATVSISNVLTLAAGQTAYVTNVGTPEAAQWIIGIPAGSNGAIGAQGIQGLTGASGSAATIQVSNVLTLAAGSAAYVTNVGSSTAAVWLIGIPAGSNGLTGANGEAGQTGPAGTNATISLTNTVTLAPGEPASVTNLGTAVDALLQFSIPRGSNGIPGEIGPAGAPGPTNIMASVEASNLPIVIGTATVASAANWLTVGNGTNVVLHPGLWAAGDQVAFGVSVSNFGYGSGYTNNLVLSTNVGWAAMATNVACTNPTTVYWLLGGRGAFQTTFEVRE